MINTARILLAEDNINDAELCIKAFSHHNLSNRVDVVRDGVEALEYLRCIGSYSKRNSGNPLFVILDIKMPRKDGLQVLKEVKSDEKLKTIPVVILTSSKQERDIISGYNLGVNAYVVKPVDFTKFVEIVREIGLFWAVVNQPTVER
jgi:DNA-binding response OmpR family regulator